MLKHFAITAILSTLLLASAAASSQAATRSSTNFVVTARRQDVADQVAQYAEHFRKQKAIEWLGRELPTWDVPCSINVKVTYGGASGATSFRFHKGRVEEQHMTVEGPLDRILDSVLPHEITHTVFAWKFRRPLPRWADEGGAVLSEDYQERARHDLLVREVINTGRMIPLSRLFVLEKYPDDVAALYAQGFSVANYLVSLKGRQRYLAFVAAGQKWGWDAAVAGYYGHRSVAELEQQWIQWLIAGRGTGADGPPILAKNEARPSDPIRSPVSESEPVVRGQMPDDDAFGDAPLTRNGQQASSADATYAAAAPRTPVSEPRPFAMSSMPDSTSAVRSSRPAPDPFRRVIAATAPQESATAEQESVEPVSAPPLKRMIPIAVGRTRRSRSTIPNFAPAEPSSSGFLSKDPTE